MKGGASVPRDGSFLVIGSLNMDLVVRVDSAPRPGETIFGREFLTVPGGKGANQAAALGRLGADVSMVGRVGDDVFGETLRTRLAEFGVDVRRVRSTEGVAIFAVAGAEGLVGLRHAIRLAANIGRSASSASLRVRAAPAVGGAGVAAVVRSTEGVAVFAVPRAERGVALRRAAIPYPGLHTRSRAIRSAPVRGNGPGTVPDRRVVVIFVHAVLAS